MPGPEHFEQWADVYGDARPPYPPELWDAVHATGLLTAGRRALDLGAGSGEATGPLLVAGMEVVAVEPGPRLAARLSARYPTARVVIGRAEDVELPSSAFDLVVAATSVHWMDLDVVLPMVRAAIRPDGRLLVWRNVFGDPAAPVTPFRRRIAEIVGRRADASRESIEDVETTRTALTRSGLFRVDAVRRFRWSIRLETDRVERLFSTFSDWAPSEVDEAVSAVRELGDEVLEHYSSWLIEASPLP